jgi:CDP-diacylglycerol--serine O-phosphatidyltransferase
VSKESPNHLLAATWTICDRRMTALGPDRSRDRRIEDPSNLWIIHAAAGRLLPWFVARGISANSVSVGGFFIGAAAALAYSQWRVWPFALLGLLLSVGWLIADGLDGMIARATKSASALGRFLDGLCDHGVFALIYISLALSIGTPQAWILGLAAALLHGLQSDLYESERARFHRRIAGNGSPSATLGSNLLVRLYDRLGGTVDRVAGRFDDLLRHDANPAQLGADYGALASNPLRLMSLLSANVRVFAVFIACMAGNPALFWWFELIPLTLILILGLSWHRSVEFHLIAGRSSTTPSFRPATPTHSKDVAN